MKKVKINNENINYLKIEIEIEIEIEMRIESIVGLKNFKDRIWKEYSFLVFYFKDKDREWVRDSHSCGRSPLLLFSSTMER